MGCLPISFNLSVRASANSFTVLMVGIGLGDLSEEELSDVIESGLFGLFGLVGSESDFTPVSVSVEGGVSLVSLEISHLRYLGWVRRRVLL